MNVFKTVNKMTLISAVLGFASLTISFSSAAQDSEKVKQLEEKFKAADKNADGKLTLDEAKDGMPRVAKAFDKIDTQKNRYITLDQIKAVMN